MQGSPVLRKKKRESVEKRCVFDCFSEKFEKRLVILRAVRYNERNRARKRRLATRKVRLCAMRRIHIFNPKAGKGHAAQLLTESDSLRDSYYITKGVGDATRYISEVCQTEPDTHFVVYGGDGTVNEAVNGIMHAGAGRCARLSVVPMGTGNDFARMLENRGEKGEVLAIDVLRAGEHYGINMMNVGFDCEAVKKTQKFKRLPLVSGSSAYILGVADAFVHKLGQEWELTLTDEEGNTELYREYGLLSLFANGRYYGGGFCSAPLADLRDGLMDVLLVRRISRLRFLSLISAYRAGRHLDAESGEVVPKFRDYMIYRRCRKMKISGITTLCVDGCMVDGNEAEIEVLPQALQIQLL